MKIERHPRVRVPTMIDTNSHSSVESAADREKQAPPVHQPPRLNSPHLQRVSKHMPCRLLHYTRASQRHAVHSASVTIPKSPRVCSATKLPALEQPLHPDHLNPPLTCKLIPCSKSSAGNSEHPPEKEPETRRPPPTQLRRMRMPAAERRCRRPLAP